MAPKGKRGRPPRGEFTKLSAVTSLRMPEDIRGQLEQARLERSRRSGAEIGFSQELLYRVRDSLSRERDEARDPALHALYYLIGQIAEAISFPFPGRPEGLRPLWRSDPFLFQAFRLAVGELLDTLKPQGEVQPPKVIANTFKKPDDLADYVVSGLLHAMSSSELTEAHESIWREQTRDYRMFDARRDLGIKPTGGKS